LKELWIHLTNTEYFMEFTEQGPLWRMYLEPMTVLSAFLALAFISGFTYLGIFLIGGLANTYMPTPRLIGLTSWTDPIVM
jgi:hypothetical protein